MRQALTLAVISASAGVLLVACGSADSDAKNVTLITHDSFSLPKNLLDDFTRQTGWTIKTVAAGDAGQLASNISLTPGKPRGDVVYGIDNSFASRPITANALQPYDPPAAAGGARVYAVTAGHELIAVDHANVCINIDPGWFAARNLAAPTTVDQLTEPRYRNQLVVMDPATSSPGLGFLLATIANHPSDWQDYWKSLKDNEVQVVSSWESGYDQLFSGGPGKGPKPIVVSYSSSPAENPRTTALLDGCFRQIEYAGVLAGAAHPDAARKVIDFLLSDQVQRALPTSMYVYPVQKNIPLPPAWQKYAPEPTNMIGLDATAIAQRRDTWQKQWREIMGR